MIAYLCNYCEKPLDMNDEDIVHLEIRFGNRAVTSEGRYGSGYSADLCSACFKKINPLIDKYYYGGNKYLKEENND